MKGLTVEPVQKRDTSNLTQSYTNSGCTSQVKANVQHPLISKKLTDLFGGGVKD